MKNQSHLTVDGVIYKYCYKCKSYNRMDAFSKNSSKKDGKACMCRTCTKKNRTDADRLKSKKNYKKRKKSLEEVGKSTYSEEYYLSKKDAIKRRAKKYYNDNKERIRKKNLERYYKNKENSEK